ncbi:MAG: hypothetical protein ACTSXG_00780 [Alphaproteobacteria bacterium]
MAYFITPKMGKYTKCISVGDIFQIDYGLIGKIVAGISVCCFGTFFLGYQIMAIGYILRDFFHTSSLIVIILGSGIVIIYSSFGGIRAVIATDVYQFVFIFIFIPLIFLIGLNKVGWFSGLLQLVPQEKLNPFYSSFCFFTF